MKYVRAYWHVLRATITYFRNGKDAEYLRRINAARAEVGRPPITGGSHAKPRLPDDERSRILHPVCYGYTASNTEPMAAWLRRAIAEAGRCEAARPGLAASI